MKKILITGSNGLLGQKLLDNLRTRKQFEIIATSIGEDRYKEDGYTYYSLDVTNKEEVIKGMNLFQPDYVINTVAMTNVDGCESKRELCHQLNVDAVRYLAEACEEHNAYMVHISTDFVFDGDNGPYKEDDKPNPLSYYGETKLMAEKVLENSKVDYSVLRTMILYGVIKDMSRSNIILWAKDSLENGKSLNIVDDQIRTPTLAEDLAEACILAIEKRAKGIYNVSGKDMVSMYELVVSVADFWNLDKTLINPTKSSSLNMAAPRPLKTGFILHKAEIELGYKPHSLEEGLHIVDEQLKSR